MWRNTMPRAIRLSLAAAGALVLVGAPTATAAPSEVTSEAESTTTTAAPTTTAVPTTTRERYVSRRESEEATLTSETTPTPAVTTTTTAAPEPSISTTSTTAPSGPGKFAAAAGRSGLSITVAGSVGTIVPGAKSANGTLTLITVRDDSSGTRGWVATASSTDFVGTNGTIPKSAVTYRATALAGELVGGDLSSKGWQSLETPKVVVERTGLYWPLEMITWTPALTVNYPDGAAVGAYSGTITISVA